MNSQGSVSSDSIESGQADKSLDVSQDRNELVKPAYENPLAFYIVLLVLLLMCLLFYKDKGYYYNHMIKTV